MKIEYKTVGMVFCGILASLSATGCVDTCQNYVVTDKNNNSIKIKEMGICNIYHTIDFGADTISQNYYENINLADTIRGKWFIKMNKKMGNSVRFFGYKEPVNVISHINGCPIDSIIKQRKQQCL